MIYNTDPHCNIFWPYKSETAYEDNITKAIINFLQYTDKGTSLEVIEFLIDEKIKFNFNEITKIEYRLQRPFREVNQFPMENRFLVGISPTGKTWGETALKFLIDEPKETLQQLLHDNDKKLQRYMEDKDINTEVYDEKVFKDLLQEAIEVRENRGDSRPDAWILLYKHGEPYVCIAVENKLYDLDPYQLRNHLEKSLQLQSHSASSQIFKKYDDLYHKIADLQEEPIQQNLLEYFYLLGYQPLAPFSRQEFEYAKQARQDGRSRPYKLLAKKWDRLFKDYFRENYIDEVDLKKYQIWFQDIDIGNIYFDVIKEDDKNTIFIGSEIGVSKRHFNETLQRNMTEEDIKVLVNHYEGFGNSFELFWRFYFINASHYMRIHSSNSLQEILDIFKDTTIYEYKVEKEACLNKLEQQGIDTKEMKIEKEKRQHWNILRYMRWISYISIDEIFNEDGTEKSIKEIQQYFGEIIEKHHEGLKILDEIYKR